MIAGATPFRRNVLLALLLLAVVVVYYRQSPDVSIHLPSSYHSKGPAESASASEELPMPGDYFRPPPPDDFCESTYGLTYLKKYRDSKTNYCEKSLSISDLTCFQKPNFKDKLEPFCVAEHVLFDPAKKDRPFQLNCEMREFPTEGPDRRLPLGEFPEHFFHTGPGTLLVDYFDITNSSFPIDEVTESALKTCAQRPKSNEYTILLKRDHTAPNHHWHSLWEIFSLYLSLDILQITRRNDSRPFFTAEDVLNAQIVVLDGREMGMMSELWSLFAKKPVKHIQEFSPDEPLCLDNVLLPIAGSANIIWSGDWRLRNCTESILVDTFAKRIMANYGVTHPVDDEKAERPLKMTVVSRKSGHRRIKDRTRLVEGIRTRHPKVIVEEVDFGDYPYNEQVRIVANSDIMIGTHGAGMALQLFLPARSSVVEIKPYDFTYWGFRNIAKFRNSPYFTIHAEKDPTDDKGWQKIEEITLDDNKFYAAVGAAVHAVEQRGFLAADIA